MVRGAARLRAARRGGVLAQPAGGFDARTGTGRERSVRRLGALRGSRRQMVARYRRAARCRRRHPLAVLRQRGWRARDAARDDRESRSLLVRPRHRDHRPLDDTRGDLDAVAWRRARLLGAGVAGVRARRRRDGLGGVARADRLAGLRAPAPVRTLPGWLAAGIGMAPRRTAATLHLELTRRPRPSPYILSE